MSTVQDESTDECPIEPVTETLAAQIGNRTCVHVEGLRKQFNTPTGVKVAVDNLNLTLYNGQITALLGHNGAGKTTAIAMLTGLIPADGGKANIVGLDMATEMAAAEVACHLNGGSRYSAFRSQL